MHLDSDLLAMGSGASMGIVHKKKNKKVRNLQATPVILLYNNSDEETKTNSCRCSLPTLPPRPIDLTSRAKVRSGGLSPALHVPIEEEAEEELEQL